MREDTPIKIESNRTNSVAENARRAIGMVDHGLGSLQAPGCARGAIEALRNLGLLSAAEFNGFEHAVLTAEADADLSAEQKKL